MAQVRHAFTVTCESLSEYETALAQLALWNENGNTPAIDVIIENVSELTLEVEHVSFATGV
jgi:hypothetical protein